MRQALHNLISDAIKYNVENGWICISTVFRPNQVEVVVANSSTGIPSAERDKVFDRFYRADSTRNRQVEGVGLDLRVTREIAIAHVGDVTLRTNRNGTVQFSLLLSPSVPQGVPDARSTPVSVQVPVTGEKRHSRSRPEFRADGRQTLPYRIR